METLFAKGRAVNKRRTSVPTSLYLAGYRGRTSTAIFLLERGSFVNAGKVRRNAPPGPVQSVGDVTYLFLVLRNIAYFK